MILFPAPSINNKDNNGICILDLRSTFSFLFRSLHYDESIHITNWFGMQIFDKTSIQFFDGFQFPDH